ncbi:MAG: hypothetical protein EPO40_10550 [Myxococcaceae bacterium]|nr:MAG: hypothetical protein EPO40_10550 [Myxococcaceae bacterium]
MRPLLCLLGSSMLAGCASSATARRDDAAVTVEDAPTAGNVTVRVGLGPLVPPRYRGGVRVRATDGARLVDALTDASGTARFTLDRSLRWDLTAAEPGYSAVSLLGVRPDLATEVLLRATHGRRPDEVRDVTLSGAILGRSAPRSAVLLDGARGTTVSRDEAFSLTLPTWPGAPLARLVALELDEASSFLNGWISPPLSPDSLAPLTVTLPAAPSRPQRLELRVDYPSIGRLTGERIDSVLSEIVARVKYTDAGAQLVPVGRSRLERPDVGSFSRWIVEAWEGELAPELIAATLRFRGELPLRASVTTRPSFRGVVPAFSVVGTLASRAGAPGSATFEVVAQGWSRAAFSVTVGDTVAWEGYGLDDAPWEARPLPPLPPGVTWSSLTTARGPVVARACVLRDLPLSPNAWMSPAPALSLRSLLTVCEDVGSTLASP